MKGRGRGIYEHFEQAPSTSKSRTISFVSSVPLRDPTAQISLVSFALIDELIEIN